MYSNEMTNYCLNCHDNTDWIQISLGVAINNNGNKAMNALFQCEKCGNTNNYTINIDSFTYQNFTN